MPSGITAVVVISASELAKVMDFSYDWVESNKEEFEKVLFNLGLDTRQTYEIQPTIQHRNRFNEIVICDRYVGLERVDKEWVNSGYASYEAKAKAANNKLLTDLFRMRGRVDID